MSLLCGGDLLHTRAIIDRKLVLVEDGCITKLNLTIYI